MKLREAFTIFVIFLVGWSIAMAGVVTYWFDLVSRLVLFGLGVVIMGAPWWLPWAWRIVKSHAWWLSPVGWGIALVMMVATGHLWAFIALFAVGVVTMVALILLRPYEMAKFRRAMEEEKPGSGRVD